MTLDRESAPTRSWTRGGLVQTPLVLLSSCDGTSVATYSLPRIVRTTRLI